MWHYDWSMMIIWEFQKITFFSWIKLENIILRK
ncbi:hypothetical protein GXY_13573 [Novacetimonas hansenii ATCC 23769]|uniref:Uncharacterized protein n=1 Tax=Novacetimonas hansenii ATCC 23769 TaxID=714995 RepID=D5QHT6_NOVHA|nr:hypothetical protein GXY_13573 [Novacetimonas hansenii ATCC 23769]